MEDLPQVLLVMEQLPLLMEKLLGMDVLPEMEHVKLLMDEVLKLLLFKELLGRAG